MISIGEPGSPERRHYEKAVERQYHPCRTGLHFCGIDDDADLVAGPHFTVANVVATPEQARALFAFGKAEFEVPDDEGDVLVDLMIAGACEDDFFMRRQMVERFQREAERFTLR